MIGVTVQQYYPEPRYLLISALSSPRWWVSILGLVNAQDQHECFRSNDPFSNLLKRTKSFPEDAQQISPFGQLSHISSKRE